MSTRPDSRRAGTFPEGRATCGYSGLRSAGSELAEDGGRARRSGSRRALNAAVRARHPRFLDALIADARITAAYRGERHEFRSRAGGVLQALRLMPGDRRLSGLAAYRLKARLARGIPALRRSPTAWR